MMNTDQINSYLEKLHATNDENTVNEETTKANVEESKTQEAQTVDATQETTKTGSEEVEIKESDVKPTEETEKKPIEDKKSSGKKYSKQEQIDYSFQKLKTREESKRKKLEARIKELEEALNKKDNAPSFDKDKEGYIKYSVEQYGKEAEKKRLEQEYIDSKRYEAEELNRKRIENCFTDEIEREKYNTLIKNNGPDFVKLLDKEDPESVVLGYLDDCDISPILVRILMTNKEYRDQVLSKSSPYSKQRAMENLEAKVRWAQKQLENRKTKELEVQEKPKIPVVGTVTKSDSNDGNIVKDYNDVLHKLNQRKYNK